MGCDIHCYAEKRGEDGKWHFIGDTQRDEPEDDDDTGISLVDAFTVDATTTCSPYLPMCATAEGLQE